MLLYQRRYLENAQSRCHSPVLLEVCPNVRLRIHRRHLGERPCINPVHGGHSLLLLILPQALYLAAVVENDDQKIGLLLWLTLLGDAAISLLITVSADKFGRRRMLLIGCLLKLFSSSIMAYVHGAHMFWLLALGMTIGVISPSGAEVREG